MKYDYRQGSRSDLGYGLVVVAMLVVTVLGVGANLFGSKEDSMTLAMQARFAAPVAQQLASSNHRVEEARS
jgi:hypothetical protein